MQLAAFTALLLLQSTPGAATSPKREKAAVAPHPTPPVQAPTSEEAPEWLTEPVEPPDPDPFGFGAYKGQRPEYMDTANVNGAEMAISQLISKDPPVVVLDWYRTELQKLGLGLIEGAPPQAPGMRYLSFRRPGSRKLKTVTLLPHGPGTMILVSVGDPSPLFKPQTPGLDLPMPPGAGPMMTSTLGESRRERHASFEVKGLAPSSVRRFYEEALPRKGYRRGEWVEGQPDAPLVFVRGGVQLTLTASPAPTPGNSQVSILWMQESP